MPDLKIQRIVAASDPTEEKYGAENLLACRRPWRGKAGAESNSVLLKLENEEQIRSVDIGNEASAYISVAVGKTCDIMPTFNILIPETAFMDPGECRTEKNTQRVKMFDVSKMNAAFASKKWDLVKVVCKQPYNKKLGFGISFIKIFGGDEEGENREPSASTSFSAKKSIDKPAEARTLFDELTVLNEESEQRAKEQEEEEAERMARAQQRREEFREEVREKRAQKRRYLDFLDDDDDEEERNLAPPREKNAPMPAPTGTILDAKGRPLNTAAPSPKVGTPKSAATTPRPAKIDPKPSFTPSRILQGMIDEAKKTGEEDEEKRSEETPKKRLREEEKEKPATTSSTTVESKDSPKRRPPATPSTPRIPKPKAVASTPTTSRAATSTPSSTSQTPKPAAPKGKNQPSLTPFDGFRFSLSGFQNPIRGRLRDMAVSLGGKYLKDVDGTITHLICAFKNTPKAKQVGLSVKVVSHHWVERCHLEKRKLNEDLFKI